MMKLDKLYDNSIEFPFFIVFIPIKSRFRLLTSTSNFDLNLLPAHGLGGWMKEPKNRIITPDGVAEKGIAPLRRFLRLGAERSPAKAGHGGR
jgi:hypothetical protein